MILKICVLGGDGFCGWPTSLKLSSLGHEVTIVDNLSRRAIDQQISGNSLVPIADIFDRVQAWKEVSGQPINFVNFDLSKDYEALKSFLANVQPEVIVHFAEQRSAPFSMKSAKEKCYTVSNNVNGTQNLLCAITELNLDPHIIHLGTMGVYGYDVNNFALPEGYVNAQLKNNVNQVSSCRILYPTNPGSIYHMTKCLDQEMFKFYAKNDGLRITDLHQGIVWGTQTSETLQDERLNNRFDYEQFYGTVLNRFLVQGSIGYPLTVHGTGEQVRAFIHISDTIRCIQLAITNPPQKGDEVSIFNQITETYSVIELAKLVSKMTGTPIEFKINPRQEALKNDLTASNSNFANLGFKGVCIKEGMLKEISETVQKYQERINTDLIPCKTVWNKERKLAMA